MALMEERAGRIETARALFIQATKTDKSSAASWLVRSPSLVGCEGVQTHGRGPFVQMLRCRVYSFRV